MRSSTRTPLANTVGTQSGATAFAHSDVRDAGLGPVRTILVPQQGRGARGGVGVPLRGDVGDERFNAPVIAGFHRSEVADEPRLVVLGDRLPTHQQEVVLTEQVAQLLLLVASRGPRDVEVDELPRRGPPTGVRLPYVPPIAAASQML